MTSLASKFDGSDRPGSFDQKNFFFCSPTEFDLISIFRNCFELHIYQGMLMPETRRMDCPIPRVVVVFVRYVKANERGDVNASRAYERLLKKLCR